MSRYDTIDRHQPYNSRTGDKTDSNAPGNVNIDDIIRQRGEIFKKVPLDVQFKNAIFKYISMKPQLINKPALAQDVLKTILDNNHILNSTDISIVFQNIDNTFDMLLKTCQNKVSIGTDNTIRDFRDLHDSQNLREKINMSDRDRDTNNGNRDINNGNRDINNGNRDINNGNRDLRDINNGNRDLRDTNNDSKLGQVSEVAEKLKMTSFPILDEIAYIKYNLMLDFCDSYNVESDSFGVSFDKIAGVSRIKLNSIIMDKNPYIEQEPYIYISINEITGNCITRTRNGSNIFGKLYIKSEQKFIEVIPSNNTCITMSAIPQEYEKFNIKFLNRSLEIINPQAILFSQYIINDEIILFDLDYDYTIKKITVSIAIDNNIYLEHCTPLKYNKQDDKYILAIENEIILNLLTDNTDAIVTLYHYEFNLHATFELSEVNTFVLNKSREFNNIISLNKLHKSLNN
jgi:hypothetical protein